MKVPSSQVPSSHKSKINLAFRLFLQPQTLETLKVQDNYNIFVLRCIQLPLAAKDAIDLGVLGEANEKHLGIPEVQIHPLQKRHPALSVRLEGSTPQENRRSCGAHTNPESMPASQEGQ